VERLEKQLAMLHGIAVPAKFGGATGNFNAHRAAYPAVDWVAFANRFAGETLGLERSQYTTQIEHYDNLAAIFDNLKRIDTILVDLARDMWMYISQEYFKQRIKAGEVGSSAMPHKRNPITAERVCGLARVVKANAQVAFDDVALWYERDISHSATERIIMPDATILLDYMLNRMKGILANIVVFDEQMMANIYRTNGVIFAQRVMNALIDKGFVREKAYDTVQPIAMKAMSLGASYQDLLKQDPTVMGALTEEELDNCFTLDYYFKNIDYIYKRNKLEE